MRNLTYWVIVLCSVIALLSCDNENFEPKDDPLSLDTLVVEAQYEGDSTYMPVICYDTKAITIQRIGYFYNASGTSIQGATLIGDTVYQFYNNGNYSKFPLNDPVNNSEVRKLETDTHCNAISSYITAGNDTLVYVEHECLYKVVGGNMQFVKHIYPTGNAGYSHDPAIDWQRRKAYFVDYARATWTDSTNNPMILNCHSFDDDYLGNIRVERQMKMKRFIHSFQDAFAVNGKVYVAFGIPSSEKGIAVFDCRTDNWSCKIYYLTSILPSYEEPEGIFYKDGWMYMTCQSGYVYKFAWDEEQMSRSATVITE